VELNKLLSDDGVAFRGIAKVAGGKGFRVTATFNDERGYAMVRFGSCTIPLDLRTTAQVERDAAAAKVASDKRAADAAAYAAHLATERAKRAEATPAPGDPIRLVPGDYVAVKLGSVNAYAKVGSIRDAARRYGQDPDAAVAENTRRREARETVQSGDMAGTPSWCEEQYLVSLAHVIAADGLPMMVRVERDAQREGAAFVCMEPGQLVDVEGVTFLVVPARHDRRFQVELSPAVVAASAA
jgi:hypothetical protein